MKMKTVLSSLSLILLFVFISETDSFARAGSSKSLGSRGSRTTSPAASPAPTAPAQSAATTSQPPVPLSAPQPSPGLFGGGFGRGLMGGMIGGMLGGMLFRSLGFAGDGLGGSGIGLFEILLLAGIGFGIYVWLKRNSTLSYSTAGGGAAPVSMPGSNYGGSSFEQGGVSTLNSVEEGLKAITAMDPQFKSELFKNQATDIFFKIQIGWGKRELSHISKFLTPEITSIFEREIARLKTEQITNHIENISLRSVKTVEAWQEAGNDYITTLISANLLDYTKNDQTGEVVAGSDTEPVSFEENWTFTRPVGSGNWILSAIQQV
jgi:predicted lipid-binding transport protein (Tim44 family)